MKSISRNKVLRWVSGPQSQGGSGAGGGSVDLAGYATQIWTEQNYVGKEFFSSLFKAYDANGNEVLPNDTDTQIDNIKAMFGFWTEQYLSALGQGSGGGGGGSSALSDLLDVQLTNPTNGQALIYNSTLGKWVNGSAGTDMASVWENLAGATTEQINVSHLTNALSGYVTTSAISDMATETWVGQQGYATQTWVNDNYLTQTAASSTYLSIAFFNRLFQAYAGTGSSAIRVNPNDTTSTIDNVKAMFGFWTEQYISALGQGTGGGGGGVGDVTWDLLADNSDTRQIALSHLTTALSGYALTSQLPTKVSQLTNDIGFITSLGDCFRYQGLVANDYVTGTTYSTITNGSYQRQLSGSTDSLLHFQIGGSASGLDIRFSYTQDNSNPLQYRKCIGSNRFAGGWVTLIDSLNIGSQSVSYATSSGSATKLSTARTIWGQSFDGTANVSGNMTGVGTISASGDIGVTKSSGATSVFVSNNNGKIGLHTDTNRGLWDFTSSKWLIATNGTNTFLPHGTVAIDGTPQTTYKLYVNGAVGVSGTFYATGNVSSSGNATFSGTLDVNGGWIQVESSSEPYLAFHIPNSNWGNLRLKANGQFYFYHEFGASSPATVNVGNLYSYGYVTALSDARHKTIINPTDLQVEQIAKMPAVVYRWNDGREDNGLHIGSIAQDWQRILPEVVMKANDEEGTLSMQYGVAALVSSIITARKVVDHERRIAELERENKELKMKLNIA